MPTKSTTKEFIIKATNVHNGYYDYSKVVYVNNSTKVEVVCPTHGSFFITPAAHLRGSGCPVCGAIKRDEAKKLDTSSFIAKATAKHGNKYDYSKVVYIDSKTKLTITCPIHGDFEQTPNNHLTRFGCKACGIEASVKKQTSTTQEFIDKAKKVHGNVYQYTLVDYKTSATDVKIICPDHGVFQQTPSNHIHKTKPQGCPTCARIKNTRVSGWTYHEWEKAGELSSEFSGYKLYIIKCWSQKETFYKVGKTFRDIHKRFKPSVMPYEWSLLHLIEGSARYISSLENTIQSYLKPYAYQPTTSFGGQYECFSTLNGITTLEDITITDEISTILESLCSTTTK